MSQPRKQPRVPPDPDAEKTTLDLIAEMVPNHEQWLNTPNTLFGGRTPQDVLNEGTYELALRDLVRAYDSGHFA